MATPLTAGAQGKSRQKFISDIVWEENKEKIQSFLHIKEAFKYLVSAGLVSQEKQEIYKDLTTEPEKRNLVIDFVPHCGRDDYLVIFIECLRSSKDAGRPHEDLVKLLKKDYNAKMKDDTISPPKTKKGPPRPLAFPVEEDAPLSRMSRSIALLKRNKGWVVLHSTSLIWLFFGIIGAIVLSQIPPIGTSAPAMIKGRREPVMAEVDLGIDPFWLSSVSFHLTTVGQQIALPCAAGLIILSNKTCSTLPRVTQEFDRSNLLEAPYYLLDGSIFNITIGEHADSNKDIFDVWYVESTVENCDESSFWDCEHPPGPTYTCRTGRRGETPPAYRASIPEYYAFCTFEKFGNTFSLDSITYNVSAIRQMYPTRAATLLTNRIDPFTVTLSQFFDFSMTDYCILLDIDNTNNQCASTSGVSYRLNIDLKRRLDIPILSFIIGAVVCLIHFLIVHCCFRKHNSNTNQTQLVRIND